MLAPTRSFQFTLVGATENRQIERKDQGHMVDESIRPRVAQRDTEKHIATEACYGKRHGKPTILFSSSTHMLVVAA